MGYIDQIEQEYDPERDLGDPRVTYTDFRLLRIIKLQRMRIDNLERKLERLERRSAVGVEES